MLTGKLAYGSSTEGQKCPSQRRETTMATTRRPANGYMARAQQIVEFSGATKIAAISSTATLERPVSPIDEQQAPDPYVTIIRKIRGEQIAAKPHDEHRDLKWINGDYQWVTLTAEQLESDRRREQYVQEFAIYA
jgi:hypothetical protein